MSSSSAGDGAPLDINVGELRELGAQLLADTEVFVDVFERVPIAGLAVEAVRLVVEKAAQASRNRRACAHVARHAAAAWQSVRPLALDRARWPALAQLSNALDLLDAALKSAEALVERIGGSGRLKAWWRSKSDATALDECHAELDRCRSLLRCVSRVGRRWCAWCCFWQSCVLVLAV